MIVNDLQGKFAVTLVSVGIFLSYAVPAIKEAIQVRDAVFQQVETVYIAPNANDPDAPHGNVSVEELQKYEDQKAAEQRRAAGL
jgi:hypothetical protein